MFVIKRTDQGGGYVARPGSRNSYTTRIERARVFDTKEDAERDRCVENEIVLPVREVMGG